MDRAKVHVDLAAGDGSDKTVIHSTTGVAKKPVQRGSIGGCIGWLLGRTFVLSWLVLAMFGKPGEVDPVLEDDEGDSMGSD